MTTRYRLGPLQHRPVYRHTELAWWTIKGIFTIGTQATCFSEEVAWYYFEKIPSPRGGGPASIDDMRWYLRHLVKRRHLVEV